MTHLLGEGLVLWLCWWGGGGDDGGGDSCDCKTEIQIVVIIFVVGEGGDAREIDRQTTIKGVNIRWRRRGKGWR